MPSCFVLAGSEVTGSEASIVRQTGVEKIASAAADMAWKSGKATGIDQDMRTASKLR